MKTARTARPHADGARAKVWVHEVEDGRILHAGQFMYLRYTAGDPYAVTLAEIGARGGELLFGRELLDGALWNGSAGEGALRLTVVCRGAVPMLLMTAHLQEGEGQLAIGAAAVREFLNRTYGVVPAGQESSIGQLDRELADVLRVA